VTAAEAEANSAYENPLIPHARMRQIYLAMLRARMLEKALPARRRARTLAGGGKAHAVVAAGLEACLVSTSVDLGPGDLVSDALTGGMVEFLRGAGLGVVLGGVSGSKGRVGFADCGGAAQMPAGPGVAERLWGAIGAAAALKAMAAQARIEAKASAAEAGEEETKAVQAGVVVAYVRPGEVAAALWRRVLGAAAEQELPIVFVAMPAARGGSAVKAGAGAKAGGVSALASSCGVPGIAVDADDAVAIYRVAQESIGRARAGGGAALMECVPFVLPATAGKAKPMQDAIAGMERSMVQRGVVKQGWMEREARAFARRLGAG
jgi:TPP-dependent pyruvate/acetoin dehydrogenase alpha subunit